MVADQSKTSGDQNERVRNLTDAAKKNLNQAAEQGTEAVDAVREGSTRMADLQDRTAESARQVLQRGVETAAQQMQTTTDRLTRTLGFSGEDSERLAQQSRRNMEVVARCGTLLTEAFQDTSRRWFELGQWQWQHNLDGMNRLTHARSLQELTAIQSELAREGLEQVVQNGRTIAETSLRAVDEASKAFARAAQ
jgi:phasin family protein